MRHYYYKQEGVQMQPKTDPSLAIGVTEIVKTFISHPDHGMKANEIPGLVKDIWKAFQDASQVSGEAIAAAAVAPASVEEPSATVQEATTAEAAVEAPPAKAKSKSRGEARTGAQAVGAPAAPASAEAPVAEAPKLVVAETAARKSGSKKTSSKAAAAEPMVTEAVAEDAAPIEAGPVDPEAALEEKFGGKVTRSPWAGMKPEDAIQQDKIICLIDGLPRKMLHRHLLARYNMTPEEYRAWFHLREDYPMTAPGYSKEKSDYAKVVGLGTTQFAGKAKASAAEAGEAVAAETAVTETAAATATPKTSRRTRKPSKQAEKAKQRTTV